MTVSEEALRRGLSLVVEGSDLPELGTKYEGKVRDNYSKDGRRVLRTSAAEQEEKRRERRKSA